MWSPAEAPDMSHRGREMDGMASEFEPSGWLGWTVGASGIGSCTYRW